MGVSLQKPFFHDFCIILQCNFAVYKKVGGYPPNFEGNAYFSRVGGYPPQFFDKCLYLLIFWWGGTPGDEICAHITLLPPLKKGGVLLTSTFFEAFCFHFFCPKMKKKGSKHFPRLRRGIFLKKGGFY